MNCGFCDHTDGKVYPTNPAQVKCVITGQYKTIGSQCNAIFNGIIPHIETCTACLVCGEDVAVGLSDRGPVICEKCKDAIMTMRERLARYDDKLV